MWRKTKESQQRQNSNQEQKDVIVTKGRSTAESKGTSIL